ncbi:Phage lysozyme [compost metagenome]
MDGLNVSATDIQRALEGTGAANGLGGTWLNGPIVVKVNVRMPVEDDPNAYEPFWYDGFYRVLTVQTTFSSGDFTQDMEMLAITDNSMPYEEDSSNPRPKGPGPSTEALNAVLGDAEPVGDRKPIGILSISEKGIEWIKNFESFAATKYMDNGRYAIGYGHNFTDAETAQGYVQLSNSRVSVNGTITKEQADELMRRDVKSIAENPIHNKVAVNMYQHEYDILCSMCYNLGSGLILGSESTLLKKLNRQLYTQVPEEIRKWNKWRRNGQLVENPGLVQRRNQEASYWGNFA